MRKIVLLIIASSLFSSCCVITSQDCFCKPDEPFLNETTKDWIAPLQSQEIQFVLPGTSSSQQIRRDYYESTQCEGGDECCSNFPILITDFIFDSDVSLLHTKALADNVEFTSNPNDYPTETALAVLNVNTGLFSTSDNVSLSEADTIVNGITTRKLIFYKKDFSKDKILFKKLEFVKGIGVTLFIDLKDNVWIKL